MLQEEQTLLTKKFTVHNNTDVKLKLLLMYLLSFILVSLIHLSSFYLNWLQYVAHLLLKLLLVLAMCLSRKHYIPSYWWDKASKMLEVSVK
jgi:hypothetical protein